MATLALLLGGCNLPTVYNPQKTVAPDIYDRTSPDLELRVFYEGVRFDSAIKPAGTFVLVPNRCIYVSNPFYAMAVAADAEGGISSLKVGSIDLAPIAASIRSTPSPASPTQGDDPVSPSVTYPNPGMLSGSHTAEVTYYTGGSSPGLPYDSASLQAKFDFGGKAVADPSASASNTSVSASTSTIDGYFVRPADATHAAGSACTPPP